MKIKGVEAVPISKSVTLLRGVCNERLKIDIEYGLRRGTTDNSYLIRVCLQTHADPMLCSACHLMSLCAWINSFNCDDIGHFNNGRDSLMQDGKNYILIDVPDENFTDDHGKPSPAGMAGVLSYLKL